MLYLLKKNTKAIICLCETFGSITQNFLATGFDLYSICGIRLMLPLSVRRLHCFLCLARGSHMAAGFWETRHYLTCQLDFVQ